MTERDAAVELAKLHTQAAMRQLNAVSLLAAWVRRWVRTHRGEPHPAQRAAPPVVKRSPPRVTLGAGKRVRHGPTPPPMTSTLPPAPPPLTTSLEDSAVAAADGEHAPATLVDDADEINASAGRGSGGGSAASADGPNGGDGGGTLSLPALDALADSAGRACADCPPQWSRDPPLGHARLTLVVPSAGHSQSSPPRQALRSEHEDTGGAPRAVLRAMAHGVGRALSFTRRSTRAVGSIAAGGGSRRGSVADDVPSPMPSPPPSPPLHDEDDAHHVSRQLKYHHHRHHHHHRHGDGRHGRKKHQSGGGSGDDDAYRVSRHLEYHEGDSEGQRHGRGRVHSEQPVHAKHGRRRVGSTNRVDSDDASGSSPDVDGSEDEHTIDRSGGSGDPEVRAVSAQLRSWVRPALAAAQLPRFVGLPDAAKAVALASLLPSRTLTSLSLRDCRLGERSAQALGQLLSSVTLLRLTPRLTPRPTPRFLPILPLQ